MNAYYNFVMNCLHEYLTDKNGFVNAAQCAISNLEVYSKFFDSAGESENYHKYIHQIISDSNIFFLDTLKELIGVFESGEYKSGTSLLGFYRMRIQTVHEYYKNLILYKTVEFIVRSPAVRKPLSALQEISSLC